MFHSLSTFFYNKSNYKYLLLFFGLFLFFNFYILPENSVKSIVNADIQLLPFDLTFGYDATYAFHFLNEIGEEGREQYLQFLFLYDAIYPLVYGGLMILVLGSLIRANKKIEQWKLLNIVPIYIILADYLENMCSIYTTLHFPEISGFIVNLGSIFTQIKWGFIGSVVGVALFLTIRVIVMLKRKEYS